MKPQPPRKKYYTALESKSVGYLERRFKLIRAEQREKLEAEARKVTTITKVRESK